MLLSGLSTKQPEIKKAMEMQAEAEHTISAGDQQSEINLARREQHATVLNNIHQFKIPAHMFN